VDQENYSAVKGFPQIVSLAALLMSILALSACSGSGAPPSTFTIGGTVVNLAGTGGGLVLQDNLKDDLPVKENGSFRFANTVASGSSYSVTISAQPSNPGQTCSLMNGSGIATADVSNIQVNCGHNEWAWVKGATTVNVNGVYGNLGVPSMSNTPGARQLPVTWIDTSGSLWLFGGYATDNVGKTYMLMNDLWKYSAGQWTWIGGSNLGAQKGTYGSLGVPSADNIPGARYEAVSWTDAAGDVWLFGGTGYDSVGNVGYLNDLWKYSGSEWTWMSGSNLMGQQGTYGIQGVPTSNNVPGARIEAVSWSDSAGNLWLFGGFGPDSTGANGTLNDLWKYSDSQWTWVAGSNLRNQIGLYGSLGVPDPSNAPGARYSAVSWTDLAGNFWIFGGTGDGSAGQSGFLNDLWKYSNGQWTWMSGSTLAYQAGVYGTQGAAGASNTPGSRQNAVSWTDSSGNLWVFGGNGVDSTGATGLLNDFWKYSNGEWSWISGPKVINQNGVYGIQGMLAPGNIPGARLVASGWVDANGNFWLFGGNGFPAAGTEGNMNDLWMYFP
jgi:N-acetylneuraminic acid mutarotase